MTVIGPQRKQNQVSDPKERELYEQEANKLIIKAKSNLLLKEPFYGTLALKLNYRATWDEETAATNGVDLIYNPRFICKQSPQEVRGLIAHELHHIIFSHQSRRQNREFERWNAAGDYAINLHLLDHEHILPQNALVSEDFRDMAAEAIYNQLPPDQEGPTWGFVIDNVSANTEAEWQVAINQALSIAKAQGKLPGYLEELVKDVVNPLIDWKDLLWSFFKSVASDDYTWKKPNRAYISEDEYLPSFNSDRVGSVAIIKDSSGSISDDEFTQFWGETCAVARETMPQRLILIQCDAAVQDIKIFEDYEDIEETECLIKGRGGTSFHPAITMIVEDFPDVEVIIYLTDLEASISEFGEQPEIPVLWISTARDNTAPWGDTVYLLPENKDEQ